MIPDGFPGQRLRVLPRPVVREALTAPITGRLLVTDCGYFPHAVAHGRSRPHGSEQAIVILCVGGAGWAQLGPTRHTVRSGTALVIPAHVPHTYASDVGRPWSIWWLHVAGADVREFVRGGDGGPPDGLSGALRVTDVGTAAALIEDAVVALERDESMASLVTASGSAWNLLSMLVASRSTQHQRVDVIARARDLLRHRVAERVSLVSLADGAGLSASHFAALFRQLTGCGVLEYQVGQRMARARELLDTTDWAVADIARASGYPDPLYFSRHFRKVHHVSPREYRAQGKG